MERLRELDMGLLLGAELFRSVLQSVAELMHRRIAPDWSPPPDEMRRPRISRTLQTSCPVLVVDQPSLHEFFQFMLHGKPVIIRGIMDDWPCTEKWKDLSYIRYAWKRRSRALAHV